MIKTRLFWKVLGNFALLLIVLSAMTLLTLNILSQIEKNFNLSAGSTQTLDNLERLRTYVDEVPAAVDRYIFRKDKNAQLIYEKGWKDFDVIILGMQREIEDTSVVRSLSDIRTLFYDWMTTVGDKKMVLGASISNGKDVSDSLQILALIEARHGHLPAARTQLRILFEKSMTTQPLGIARATSLTKELGTFISLTNILLAIFAVALGFVLTRSLTTPIRLLKQGTQNIMAGTFQPIILHRSDELGQLAADFNKMSVMLGNNYTRLKAYSELVTALNSHSDMDAVETESLRLLCQHSRASVGALYIGREEDSLLHLAAGYALKEQGVPIKTLGFGEGIPGQCALERRVMEISNIPPSSGFAIDTGLVEVPPVCIIAVPILFKEKLLGVLVLGSMRPFDELDKEIINNSVPQLGVAITNAQNFEASQKLSREIALKNDELNGKNAELEKAYRVKSDFLASMSHELRTPLNSVIGFSSVLLGPNGDPLTPDQRMGLEKILKNGRHLLQLINDILDFSKIESGRMSVNVESDDAVSIIASSITAIESLLQAKGLVLKQNIEPDLPILQTDVLKVKQILVNLLSNAAKFTEKGEITVTATAKGPNILIAVKDSGIGIKKEDYAKVFEEFQQIDSSNTRKYKGTGLGMPISRRLARLLGGELTLDSEFEKGSTFTLTIPATYVDPGKEKEMQLQKPASSMPTGAPVALPPPPTIATEKPRVDGVKVLCIDDDPDVIEILKGYLIPEGYEVTGASSGDEGITLAAELRPALITLDIMMPQKDGWQVLRELKQNPVTRDIPVVIHSIIENKPLAVSLGAVDVMPKPVEPKTLLDLVSRVAVSKDQSVLFVDDSVEFTSVIKQFLESEGFAVEIANNGQQALDKLESITPAVIFLDLIMPVMDGFELAQRLRNDNRWRNIPVVVLSGKELTDEEWKRLNMFNTEFLKKGDLTQASLATTMHSLLHPAGRS
ncbi:MAG: response regulator [Ignavibacteriales bacterium]|nr:response regulator [Ignavibacteriales bacterium]